MIRNKRGLAAISIALGILLISVIAGIYYSKVNIVQMSENQCSKGQTAPCKTLYPEKYDKGTATCKEDTLTGYSVYVWDTSNCGKCGDATIQEGEDCEHSDERDIFPKDTLGNEKTDCGQWRTPDKPYYWGVPVTCTDHCNINPCPYCGDGDIDSTYQGILLGETCDDARPLTDYQKECDSPYHDNQPNVKCEHCRLNYDGCAKCGDGKIDEPFGEECDGNTQICTDGAGYEGTQTCKPDCKGFEDKCTPTEKCGDGKKNGKEICDSLYSQECFTDKYYKGTQNCLSDCTGWDTCMPTESCGDEIVNGPEKCEPGNTQDCKTLEGYAGTQECKSDCTGFKSCTTTEKCGDGIVNGLEECEGEEQKDCVADKEYNGKQTCNNCIFGECVATESCGDSTINGIEECDGTTEEVRCTSGCTKCFKGCTWSIDYAAVNSIGYYNICVLESESGCMARNPYCAPIYDDDTCYKSGDPKPGLPPEIPSSTIVSSRGGEGGGGGGGGTRTTTTTPKTETAITTGQPGDTIVFSLNKECGGQAVVSSKTQPTFVPSTCEA